MDYAVAHSLDQFTARHDGFEDVLSALMPWAEYLFAAVIIGLFLLVPGRQRSLAQRAAVAAGASFILAAVVAHFIAGAIDRPRPFVAHPATIHAFLAHAADAGFPSDHATAAFAIATAVALRQRSWGAVLLVLAACVAAGRVFLGLHYPLDVVAGALLGVAAAAMLHLPPAGRAIRAVADWLATYTDRVLGGLRASASESR